MACHIMTWGLTRHMVMVGVRAGGRGQGAGLMGEEGAALEVVGSHVGEGAAVGDQPDHRGLGRVARASSRGG